MKKTLQFLFALLFVATINAQTVGDTFTVGDLNYQVTAVGPPNQVKVTGPSGTEANIVVPATVNDGTYDYDVVALTGFINNADLVTIQLPSSVVLLENGAFRNCDNLVTTDYSSVKTLVSNSLSRNAGFEGLSIDISSATEIQGYTFWESYIAEVDISSAVTIGANAFRRTALTYIKLPSTVTSIGSVAFTDSNISAVEVYWTDAGNLPTIAADAFGSSTVTLYVPIGTSAIYENAAVWQDHNIVEGTIPVNLGVVFTEGDYNYVITGTDTCTLTGTDNDLLDFATIPMTANYDGGDYTVTAIADNAFYQHANLELAQLPSSVVSIGNQAFMQSPNFATINTENVTSIGSNAFRETIVSTLDLSEVTTIASNGLGRMAKLTGVLDLPKIENLGPYAFVGPDTADGTHITGLNLGGTLTSVDPNTFYRLRDLALITVATDTPPALANDGTAFDLNTTPSSGDVSSIELYVPSSTGVSNYSAAAGWSQFTNIAADGTLSVEDVDVTNFTLYPNPTNNVVSIKNSQVKEATVTVYDVKGRALLNQNISTPEAQINLSGFSKGIYIFKVQTGNGEFTKRIIKQ